MNYIAHVKHANTHTQIKICVFMTTCAASIAVWKAHAMTTWTGILSSLCTSHAHVS